MYQNLDEEPKSTELVHLIGRNYPQDKNHGDVQTKLARVTINNYTEAHATDCRTQYDDGVINYDTLWIYATRAKLPRSRHVVLSTDR